MPPRAALAAALILALLLTGIAVWRGPGRFLRDGRGPWINALPATFEAWETRPIREHMFLAFLSRDDVEHGRAYTHYSHPLLFLQYALLLPLRWGGLPYERAQVLLTFPHLLVVILLLCAHAPRVGTLTWHPLFTPQHVQFGACVLAFAGVCSLPSFWVALVRFNPEHFHFVPALAFCHLSALDGRGQIHNRSSWIALTCIALLSPIFAPFALLSWVVIWTVVPERGPTDWWSIRRLTIVAALAAVAFLLPKLCGHLSSFTMIGSSLAFRSGLDGSQEHFTSIFQAVFTPSYPPGRAWFVWPWPVAALVAIALAAVYVPAAARSMARQLFICWLPFLWMLVCFPQLVSIHPYQFDFHLCLGAALCIALWLQRPDLAIWTTAPAGRLAIMIMLAGLVMTNFIDLARIRFAP